MSLNEHYSPISQIPGESAKTFLTRFREETGEKYPSIYEMATYYTNFIELRILELEYIGAALEWCYDTVGYDNWYSFNAYFVFDDEHTAVMFKLQFPSERPCIIT